MKKDKPSTVIVSGASSDQLAGLGTLLINLCEVGATSEADVIFFHEGISSHQESVLRSISPNIHLRRLDFDGLSKELLESSSLRYFTRMVFSKYECFKLLTEYERVIW